FLQDKREIFMHYRLIRFFRMDNEESDHSHQFLHRSVRVIEEGAVLMKSEFVGECLARLDEWLTYIWRAVHLDRHFNTMPMKRCILGQHIMENYPYAVALVDLNCRPGHAAVVAPYIDHFGRPHTVCRQELAFDD